MATRPVFDWTLAQALWLQGVPRREIAKQIGCPVGTLEKRAQRHGWTKARAQASALVGESMLQTAVRDIPAIARRFRNRMAEDAERTMEALAKQDPSRMKLERLEARERIADGLTKRAWTVMGLDAENQSAAVNINLLASLPNLPKTTVETAPERQQIEDEPETPTNPG